MKKYFNRLFILLALIASNISVAGVLIEPQLGYTLSGSKGGSFGNVPLAAKGSGVEYGARLGYQFLGLMGGFNYQHASLSVDSTIVSVDNATLSNTFKKDSLGVFIGFNAPILIRAWLGYNFSEKITCTSTNNHFDDGDYFKGNSTELGIGFTGLPFLSMNLIYKMDNYTTAHTVSPSADASGSMKPTEIIFAVSAPFDI
jgi:hypothetical protein